MRNRNFIEVIKKLILLELKAFQLSARCILYMAANPCPALGRWSAYFGDLFDMGGDDFKISCLGEFFLVYPNSCFCTHSHQIFLMTYSFCSPALFPISCSNSLIPKKITPPCILRPPKYFPLEPSLKNIGACWAMGKNQNYWGDGGQILGGMNLPIPPGFAAWYCKHTVYSLYFTYCIMIAWGY